jgi:PIN domain nuclease of toxin-antitoxin system
MILLDTHIWLWWLLGSSNLSEAEIFALDQSASKKRIAISWVSIWETEMLENAELPLNRMRNHGSDKQ